MIQLKQKSHDSDYGGVLFVTTETTVPQFLSSSYLQEQGNREEEEGSCLRKQTEILQSKADSVRIRHINDECN